MKKEEWQVILESQFPSIAKERKAERKRATTIGIKILATTLVLTICGMLFGGRTSIFLMTFGTVISFILFMWMAAVNDLF